METTYSIELWVLPEEVNQPDIIADVTVAGLLPSIEALVYDTMAVCGVPFVAFASVEVTSGPSQGTRYSLQHISYPTDRPVPVLN